MPRLELQTAMISAFEFCKKKAIPIQFAAKPRGLVQLERITFRADLTFQKNLSYFFALNLILSLGIVTQNKNDRVN